jgi:hypothetical protein
MSEQKLWVRIVQIVGVVLILWAAVTLISGLAFAEVDPEDPEFGRAYPFEDTGIAGYGTIAWVGGIVGIVLVVVTYLLGKKN